MVLFSSLARTQAVAELLAILIALMVLRAPPGSAVSVVSDASTAGLAALANLSSASDAFGPLLERISVALLVHREWDIELVWNPGVFQVLPDVALRPS